MKLSNGEINELEYLANGGSSVSPLYAESLFQRGLISKPELCVGSGYSSGSFYPLVNLTDAGWRFLYKRNEQ